MWVAINKVLDFILGLINSRFLKKEPEELRFLRERKELRASQVWLLEIFESSSADRFGIREVYPIWLRSMLVRTSRPESDFSVDGIHSRLMELTEVGFLTKERVRDKSSWILSDAYLENFTPREDDMTVIIKPDGE